MLSLYVRCTEPQENYRKNLLSDEASTCMPLLLLFVVLLWSSIVLGTVQTQNKSLFLLQSWYGVNNEISFTSQILQEHRKQLSRCGRKLKSLPYYSALAVCQAKSMFYNVNPRPEADCAEILLQASLGDQQISPGSQAGNNQWESWINCPCAALMTETPQILAHIHLFPLAQSW